MVKKKKDPERVTLCTLAGRIVAYRRVNKEADAKRWARALVFELVRMGLINARSSSPNELIMDCRGSEELAEKESS